MKAEVSLQRLVESAGVVLVRRGADLVGRCPFHDDSDPSLVVCPAKNLWHCLGACSAGGSVVDWVMRVEGVSFRHTVELLRADAARPVDGSGEVLDGPKAGCAVRRGRDRRRAAGPGRRVLRGAAAPRPTRWLPGEARGSITPRRSSGSGWGSRTARSATACRPHRKSGAALRGRLQDVGVLARVGA